MERKLLDSICGKTSEKVFELEQLWVYTGNEPVRVMIRYDQKGYEYSHALIAGFTDEEELSDIRLLDYPSRWWASVEAGNEEQALLAVAEGLAARFAHISD